MIIDRLCDSQSGFVDMEADVMTSPVNFWSFYGSSSPVTDPGQQSPWTPSGECEERSCSNALQNGMQQTNLLYQGVRVKTTVKELIMQRRTEKQQQQEHEIQFPAITSLLQPEKRAAEMISPHSVTKRPATEHNNILSPYNQSVNILNEPSVCEEYGGFFSNAGLSIEAVKVQDSPMPVCQPLQKSQEPLPFTTIPSPPYASCQLSQVMERPYTYQFQTLSPQRSFESSGSPAPPVSFFQWQIQQEEEKTASLSPSDLTYRDTDGDTFLHIAVAQGRRALAYVLAKKMTDLGMLDIKEHNNQSAFQVSVAANQHLIAQDLLSLGAQVNTVDVWGRTPLHVCAEKGHTLILQAIQKSMHNSGQKVNVEAVNYDGLTPLHIAVLSHNAVVQELSCVTAPQSPQTTALMQRRKMLGECINILLLMGASYGTMDCKSGRTALHMAAEEANVELLRLFLDQSDSLSVINIKAYNGNTALHMAAAQNGRQAQLHAVQLLMRRGADPSVRNLENEQPVQLVLEGPTGDQVRRILKGRSLLTRSNPL